MIRVSPFRWARLASRVSPPRLLGVVWAIAILAAEVYLRTSPSDIVDGLGVAVLGVLVLITGQVHRTTPLMSVTLAVRLIRHLRASVARFALRVGVDFRKTPPLPAARPTVILVLLVSVFLALAVTLRFRSLIPGELRTILMSGSTSIYLIVLSSFWSVLSGAVLVLGLFVIACVHNALVTARWLAGPNRAALEGLVFLAGGGALLGAAINLPVHIALTAIWGVLVVSITCVLIPGTPNLLVIWRERGGDASGVVSWTHLVVTVAPLVAGTLTLLILLALGDGLAGARGVHGGQLPITTFLGGAVAWTGALAYATWAWMVPLKSVIHRFRDPTKPQPTRVVLAGRPPTADQRDFPLRAAGFQVTRANAPSAFPGHVVVELDEHAPPLDLRHESEFVPGETLRVHPDDLFLSELHEIIRRCDDVEQRRALLRGLETALESAGERRFAKGRGFWVAPHWWFIAGLSRDTNEDDSWTVGPPYHRCIPLAARHHLYRVLQTLEIDLIFVEDGVTLQQLRLVFQTLFDVYDLFGGSRVEDRHFDGLLGLRVVVHDFTMEHPYRARGYPELDYQEVGRARILHVFRDRGGGDEHSGLPSDADVEPEPARA